MNSYASRCLNYNYDYSYQHGFVEECGLCDWSANGAYHFPRISWLEVNSPKGQFTLKEATLQTWSWQNDGQPCPFAFQKNFGPDDHHGFFRDGFDLDNIVICWKDFAKFSTTFPTMLAVVQAKYPSENPFHNFSHGLDVPWRNDRKGTLWRFIVLVYSR